MYLRVTNALQSPPRARHAAMSLHQPVSRATSRFIPAGTPVVLTEGPPGYQGLVGEFPDRSSGATFASPFGAGLDAPAIELPIGGVRKVGATDEWYVLPVQHTAELRHLKPLDVALRAGWIYRWQWYHDRKGWQTYNAAESAVIEQVT